MSIGNQQAWIQNDVWIIDEMPRTKYKSTCFFYNFKGIHELFFWQFLTTFPLYYRSGPPPLDIDKCIRSQGIAIGPANRSRFFSHLKLRFEAVGKCDIGPTFRESYIACTYLWLFCLWQERVHKSWKIAWHISVAYLWLHKRGKIFAGHYNI